MSGAWAAKQTAVVRSFYCHARSSLRSRFATSRSPLRSRSVVLLPRPLIAPLPLLDLPLSAPLSFGRFTATPAHRSAFVPQSPALRSAPVRSFYCHARSSLRSRSPLRSRSVILLPRPLIAPLPLIRVSARSVSK